MMKIKINKPDWNAEGFSDMMFTADYLNTVYECCNKNCEGCTLNIPILNGATTACILMTKTKMKLLKTIKDEL